MRGAVSAAFAVIALVAVCPPAPARADLIDDEVRQLATATGYKRRLAAVLALSKSHDRRAVLALAVALRADKEAQIRRVAALALSKAIDETTPADARAKAFEALEATRDRDRDRKVQEVAGKTLERLAALRRPAPVAPVAADTPAVYVHMIEGGDLSRQAPSDAVGKLLKTVRGTVSRRAREVSTEWPGTLPTAQVLRDRGARAFVVAPSISKLAVVKKGNQAEVECTVAIRVAPWGGTDGSEKWSAQKAAQASGTGKAITSTSPAAISMGMKDCVLAVAEDVTAKEVVPFLRKLIGDS